jgi:hypothetical protein
MRRRARPLRRFRLIRRGSMPSLPTRDNAGSLFT